MTEVYLVSFNSEGLAGVVCFVVGVHREGPGLLFFFVLLESLELPEVLPHVQVVVDLRLDVVELDAPVVGLEHLLELGGRADRRVRLHLLHLVVFFFFGRLILLSRGYLHEDLDPLIGEYVAVVEVVVGEVDAVELVQLHGARVEVAVAHEAGHELPQPSVP